MFLSGGPLENKQQKSINEVLFLGFDAPMPPLRNGPCYDTWSVVVRYLDSSRTLGDLSRCLFHLLCFDFISALRLLHLQWLDFARCCH